MAKSKAKSKATAKPSSKPKAKPTQAKPKSKQAAPKRSHAPRSVPDRIVWWCLHALVFAVPLAISNLTYLSWLVPSWELPLTYDQFDIVKAVLMRGIVLVAFGAWAWARLSDKGSVRRTRLDWLVLALVGWMILTSFTSIHPITAVFGKYRRFDGLISMITYALIYFLTVQAVDRPEKIRSLARTLVLSGSIVALYGVSQYLGFDLIKWGSLPFEAQRAFATYGNPDLLGGYLMFPLPISLALALSEKDSRWRVFYGVAFGIIAVCWVVSFVRGAWIGGVVGVGIVVWSAYRKKVPLESSDKWVMAAGGLGVFAVAIRSLFNHNAVLNLWTRIQSIFQFDRGSARTRFEIWQAAWDATKDRPITGFGADTFRLVFPRYKPIEYVADAGYLSVADNVHNYPLQMSAAIGIPGVILLYAVFVRALWLSARDALAGEGGERMLFAGFWAASAGYLTHLLFGLSVTGTSFLLWFSMGILLAVSAKAATSTRPARSGSTVRTVLVAIALVVVAVGSYLNLRYIAADRQYLLSKIGVLESTDRISAAQRAIDLNPFNDMYRAELGLAYTEQAIQSINAAQAAANSEASPESALRDARAAFLLAEEALMDTIEFVPPEYDNYVFLANLYNLGGTYLGDKAYYEKAVGIAERGIEVEEYGPAIRVQAGRALIALERYDEAIEHLSAAADMDPDYGEPRTLLAQAYVLTGDDRSAAIRLAEALDLQGENNAALDMLGRMTQALMADGPGAEDPAVVLIINGLNAEYADAPALARKAADAAPAAIAIAPDEPMVLRRAAQAFLATDRTEDAIEALEALDELASDLAWPLNTYAARALARIYESQGDYATAADYLDRSLEIDSRHSYIPRSRKADSMREKAQSGGDG